MKVDRGGMLCSLEIRAVFLDNDLVSFCQRLPHRFKYRNGQRKYLLKKAALRLLPVEIVNRRKKGFGIPIADWLRTVPAVPPLGEVGTLNTVFAKRAWAEHRAGTRDHRLFLWSWLSFQAFAEHIRVVKPRRFCS
jgi:asparagine synthase (glutamine-hydrolysing)